MKSLSLAFLALTASTATADIAVDVLPGANDSIFPAASTTHGWQFSVTVPIEITHLGLYDRNLDGFFIDHPVGLWDGDGVLLVEETLTVEGPHELIENFRYVDVMTEGTGILLTPGEQYTIGFFSATFNQEDGMVIFDGTHTVNPVIDYVGVGVSGVTNGLEMPTELDEFDTHRWGPNFQFTIVPAPAVFALIGLAAFATSGPRGGRSRG